MKWYRGSARGLLHAFRRDTELAGRFVTVQYIVMHSPFTNPATTMHGRISRPSLDLEILPLAVIKSVQRGKCCVGWPGEIGGFHFPEESG